MSEVPDPIPLRPTAHPNQDGGPAGTPPAPASPAPPYPSPEIEPEGSQAETSFRLKLRPRAPAPPPAQGNPPPQAPSESSPAAGPSTPKIRLKPKLTSEPEAPAEPAAPPASEIPAKNQPHDAEATIPPTAGFDPISKGAAGSGKTVPPFLVAPSNPSPPRSPSNPALVVGPTRLPHIKGPDGSVELPEPMATVDPVQRKGFKIGLAIVGTVLALAFLIGGLILWKSLSPSPKPPGAKPAKAAGSSGIAQVSNAATTTLSSINQVQTLIKDTQQTEQARVDALAEGREPPSLPTPQHLLRPTPTPSPAPGPSPARVHTPAPAPRAVGPASAESPTPSAALAEASRDEGPPQASAAFRRFVTNASIPGVYQGTPARALINGCTVQAGELANRELGIVFVGIDARKKTITFRDATGAEVTRGY